MRALKLLISATLLGSSIHAQNIDSIVCHVIDVFNKKDSIAFTQLFVKPGDTKFILEARAGVPSDTIIKDENETDSLTKDLNKKLAQVFLDFYQQWLNKGVNWGQIVCDSNKIESKLIDDVGFPIVNGSIIFNSGNKKFKLILSNMMKLRTSWKLVNLNIEEIE